MAKETNDAASDKAELKKLLTVAREKPVFMAFALGQDGKAVIKLDKLKPARNLEKGLKDGVQGSRNHRFGTVMIDPQNPKIVTFVVNKEVGGIAPKLVAALKGTGFKKIRLVTEDGVALEEAEGAEDDAGTFEAGPSHAPSDAPAPAPSPAPQTPATPDAASLTRTLAGLVKQMLGVIAQDPSQKAALAQLATDAQASLKRGDLDQAAAGIEILRQAVGDAATPAQADSPPADDPAGAAMVQKLRKSRVAWMATRTKLDGELAKLSQAIMQASDGEDMGDDLESQFYAAIDPVTSTLDDSLLDLLDQAADADGDDRAELLAQTRDAIDRYMAFVEGNDIIAQLDANPFVPLAIGKILTGTLGALARSMA